MEKINFDTDEQIIYDFLTNRSIAASTNVIIYKTGITKLRAAAALHRLESQNVIRRRYSNSEIFWEIKTKKG